MKVKVSWVARQIPVALLCVMVAIGGGLTWWEFSSSSHGCEAESSVTAGVIRAAKVVARPWMGPHHVYGVFVVPAKYGDSGKYRATMTMPAGNFVVEAGGERGQWSDLVIPSGYFPKQVYVPTRLVLWRVMSGRLKRIGDPCNWTLRFVERN